MIKILVVEDHILVREGLLVVLEGLGEEIRTFSVGDTSEAVRVLETEDIDLMMLDLMLPGIQGEVFLPIVRRRFPKVAVVVMSAQEDVDTVSRVMTAGASGYFPKSGTGSELLATLRAVLSGEIYLPPKMRGRLERSEKADGEMGPLAKRFGLTPAQERVLKRLAEGRSNRQIAELLGSRVGTVKVHVTNIMKTLGVTNRAEAALMANCKQRRKVQRPGPAG